MPRLLSNNLHSHRERVWQSIADGLERLLVAKRSYASIALADVAAEAGLVRNTLYSYGKTVDALLVEVTRRVSEDLATHVREVADQRATASERLVAVLTTILAWFASGPHRTVVATCFSTSLDEVSSRDAHAPLKALEQLTEQILRDGSQQGVFRQLPVPSLTISLMSGALGKAIEQLLVAPHDLQQTTDETVGFILAAIAAPGSK